MASISLPGIICWGNSYSRLPGALGPSSSHGGGLRAPFFVHWWRVLRRNWLRVSGHAEASHLGQGYWPRLRRAPESGCSHYSNRFRRFAKLATSLEKKVPGAITHVATKEAVAALTFDDGPHPQSTPAVLDVLEQYQVHATFFMLGEMAQQYPDLVRQVAQAGHAIGNHSWDHPQFPLISSRDQRWQMRACERALAPYGQRLFRPPFGQHNAASRLNAWWLGYRVIMWDLDARDWIDDNAHSIAARLVHQIHSGSIVLLHDGLFHPTEERYAHRQAMHEAMAMVLQRLDGRFRFVTIPELIQLVI
jgi:peptidoglycan/xylan/chitin deacetylase (PgdA/CDA1 family)